MAQGTQHNTTTDSDALAAVGALYQCERADVSGLFAQSFALTSLGIAYMGVAAGFLGGSNEVFGGELLPLLLALPAWTVGAYHVLIVANVFVHNSSVAILERRLVDAAGLSEQADSVGARAGDLITNINTQPKVLIPQTLISYGGIYVLIASFTAYCIANAYSVASDAWTTEVITFTAIYALFAVLIAAAWFYVLVRLNKS